MNLEAHMACGWLLGNIWPGAGRHERFLAVAAAIVCDVDGLSYLAGESAYANWHHTIGHNVLIAAPLLIVSVVVARKGRMLSTALLVQLAFLTHMLGDYFFSGWGIPLWWPISREEVIFHYHIGLDHPINMALSYGAFVLLAASPWIWGRTPLEFVSPRLDAMLARAAHLGQLYCDECGSKLALRQAVIGRGTRIICRTCASRERRKGSVTPPLRQGHNVPHGSEPTNGETPTSPAADAQSSRGRP